MQKYAKILKNIILFADPKRVEGDLSAFVTLLQEDGALLNAEAIMDAALVQALKEIESGTVNIIWGSKVRGDVAEKIRETLRKFLVKEKIDPSLIAGVGVDFPGHRVDSSLLHRINILAAEMRS